MEAIHSVSNQAWLYPPRFLALIKLIYAGRVPAITHKPLPGARVLLRLCERCPVCAYVICVYYGESLLRSGGCGFRGG